MLTRIPLRPSAVAAVAVEYTGRLYRVGFFPGTAYATSLAQRKRWICDRLCAGRRAGHFQASAWQLAHELLEARGCLLKVWMRTSSWPTPLAHLVALHRSGDTWTLVGSTATWAETRWTTAMEDSPRWNSALAGCRTVSWAARRSTVAPPHPVHGGQSGDDLLPSRVYRESRGGGG
jgi:hypothetical protein